MYQAIGVIEFKSLATGIEATDAALKSAGIRLVSAHPACPGKFEIILTGALADVNAAVDHVKARFEQSVIDSSVMGRIDPTVIEALLGTRESARQGSLGVIETFSAAAAIKAADIAVKCARVEIYDLRVSRGIGGKGLVLITGDVGDVTASVQAGADHAASEGLLCRTSVIPSPHGDLWEQI